MKALVLRDLAVSRGAGPVIAGVNLVVEPRKVTALVGPNGAGKTSLLEAISGVISPSAGEITLDGEPVAKLSRVQRARAGIVHIEQGRAVFPSLTVMENLRLTATSEAKVTEVLEMFPELERLTNKASGLLSGGEQQMVVLARAFASEPKFLLIDEMSLGLAPVVFMRLLPIVQDIAKMGVGVLLVEQFTNLALGIASEATVVSSGRVTYSGSSTSLRKNPDLLKKAYLGNTSAA